MRSVPFALSALLLAACAPPPGPMPVEPYPPYTGGPPEAGDECGASRYRWLVGRSHAEVPPRPIEANWRVVARGDAMTRDLRPARLNIIYDRVTHRVIEVYCG